MNLLKQTITNIGELDAEIIDQVQKRLDFLIKPPGSLGFLEDLAKQIGGITRNPSPIVKNKRVILMGGDHGVVEEGVSAFPQDVTAIMMAQFVKGVAGINVLANYVGAKVVPVDVGVANDLAIPGLINKKVRKGTANFTQGPAMSREEAIQALEVGIEVASAEIANGADILATGDMGIGNTTPSSALLAVFGGFSPEEVVGRGTGVNDESLNTKARVITKAIEINQPDQRDPIDVLAKVGGLEIAGLAGVILGAAANRKPIVIDGFISSAAALVAVKIAPQALNFMIPSHASAEYAHRAMLETIGLKPVLDMQMRLGEGTGAVLVMGMAEAATNLLREMATFADIGLA
jgi:nicotinate-nucleotide--dimethylbenzimidazole phosphoribosyltransferase